MENIKKIKLTKKQIIIISCIIGVIIAAVVLILVLYNPNPLKGRWKCNQNNITFEMSNSSFEFYITSREKFYQKGKVEVIEENSKNFKIKLTAKQTVENKVKNKEVMRLEYSAEKTDINKMILTNLETNAKYSCELQ